MGAKAGCGGTTVPCCPQPLGVGCWDDGAGNTGEWVSFYNPEGSVDVVDVATGDPAYMQILINVDVGPIDGPNGVLGQAGPTLLRPGSLLTLEGDMSFDEDDLAVLEGAGLLDEVVKHEMAHVLGFGTLWQLHGLSTDLGTADAGFTGPAAVAEYNAMPGAPGGQGRVPVEWNTGSPGSDDGHWDTSPGHNDPGACFDNELMSFSLSGSAAVSRVTLASLTDLGYPGVDMAQADPYVCGQP